MIFDTNIDALTCTWHALGFIVSISSGAAVVLFTERTQGAEGVVEVDWTISGTNATLDFQNSTGTAVFRDVRETPASVSLCCTILYCTVLCCIVLYCTVLYCTALCCIVLYCTVLYCNVLYCTVLYCTVLYCTVLYCTVL